MIRNLSIVFAFLLLLTSCNSEGDGRTKAENLPVSNGGVLDVIIVAKESLWQSEAGDEFREYFTTAQVGLPQPEAAFTIRQVEPKEMNMLLQRSRNIVRLQKGERAFNILTDYWAKPQLLIEVSAPDEKQLADLIETNQGKIKAAIKKLEMQVIRDKMASTFMEPHEVLKNHNLSMKIPKTFDLEKAEENLLVYWNRTIKTDQGIIIYIKPLQDELTTLGAEIIPLRDSLTQLYIQGTRENTYMVVEDLVPPQIIPTEVSGVFALETRGLWRLENDFMGGPFINYTVYDEKNNQLIFLDGFIFSPETTKRNFVLELESILRSLEIH